MTSRHLVTTRTGIQIGRAYTPARPVRAYTLSEERVQAALLAPRRRCRIRGFLLAIVIALTAVGLALDEMDALFLGDTHA